MKKTLIVLCTLLLSTAVLAARPCKPTDFKGCLKACQKKKNGPSCKSLADLYLAGKNGAPQDETKAYEAMKRGCELGDKAACALAGGMAEKGTGVAANPDEAIALYTTGCLKKHGPCCMLLGTAYEAGTLANKDPAKAAEFFGKACQLKDDKGCVNLSVLELRGEGIPANAARAIRRLDQLCKKKVGRACTEQAGAYLDGKAGSVDQEMAKEAFVAGCKYGDATACQRYSENFSGPQAAPASAPTPAPQTP